MSSNSHYQPSTAYHPSAQHHRPHTAAAISRQVQQQNSESARAYTLMHAGRQVRIGPVAFWIVVGTVVVMGVWSLGTGTYFAFKEDVLTRLIGRQAEMQFAYEDRVAELRAQIDRLTSRQLLDQEQFEQKLDVIGRRQIELERRTAQIGGEGGAPARGKKSAPSKPVPLSDNGDYSRDQKSWFAWLAPQGGLEARLKKLGTALDTVEDRQGSALTAMKDDAEAKAKRIQTALAELGLDLGNKHDITGSIGGPFVPAKTTGASFEKQLIMMRAARAQYERFTVALAAVPVRKPVEGDIDMSSPFGQRMDPFLRGPAIHTGVDLRGDTGDPVRVTANGTVVTASWQGGYGNMIEIDHGNGFSTRYGHLSKIEVKVGHKVKIGDTIGLIGSTGPHLHYETRVNDSAVDPQKFFKAGNKLGMMGDL